jgi:hypothetical protein
MDIAAEEAADSRNAAHPSASRFAQSLSGDLRIERRGRQFFMSKQHLDRADIFPLFEQGVAKASRSE